VQIKSQLKSFWEQRSDNDGLCLCLTGSSARSEYAPFSDLDILILVKDSASEDVRLQAVLQDMHSMMPRMSAVVRSVEDCRRMRTEDFRSWLALLDTSYIAGEESLFIRLWRDLTEDSIADYGDVYNRLKNLTSERHLQYGASTALLEPNVKNSAGSLRDIQTVCYLEIISLLRSRADVFERKKNWDDIIENSSLLPERRLALQQARRFLLHVRRRMHEIKGHLHDTLEFELQPLLSGSDERWHEATQQRVEYFMRSYYQHSRTVHLSLELSFFDHAPDLPSGTLPWDADIVHVPESGLTSGEDVLSTFLNAADTRKTIGSDVIRAMLQATQFDFSTIACGKLFDQLLRKPSHVGASLRSMHECGILKLVFPEFEPVEHFFQHNIYHFYTLDEHTIKMIEAAEQLLQNSSAFGDVYRDLKDKSLLYYAILLHDIAKPVDIARHEIEGARMVPDILRRYDRNDAVNVVAFLVRNHLQMEQIAFRRDIRDMATVRSFAELVVNEEQLKLLFVLTYADMSALNPRVLTEWKKVLLTDLYGTTIRYLRGDVSVDLKADVMKEPSRPDGISEAEYFRAVEDVREGEPVRIFVIQHRAYTEIVVFCMDRPLLLSQLAAALLGADVSVVDASIDTRIDVAIDMFRITDLVRNSSVDEQGIRRLRELIRDVCTAEVQADEIFRKFRRKWVRKIRRTVHASVRTEVLFVNPQDGAGDDRTIIEVYAPDAYGLLYILCREISSFGLNIVFAKIATRVDGVVDSFYVREASGLPFTDASRREQLRQTLLRRISDVSHAE